MCRVRGGKPEKNVRSHSSEPNTNIGSIRASLSSKNGRMLKDQDKPEYITVWTAREILRAPKIMYASTVRTVSERLEAEYAKKYSQRGHMTTETPSQM